MPRRNSYHGVEKSSKELLKASCSYYLLVIKAVFDFFDLRQEKEEIIGNESTSMESVEHEDDVVYCGNSWIDDTCVFYEDVTGVTTNINDPVSTVEVSYVKITNL